MMTDAWMWLLGGLVLSIFGYLFKRRASRPALHEHSPLEAQIARPGASMADVEQLANDGKMIEAIKAYRAATGSDLKTAKEAVEAMLRRR